MSDIEVDLPDRVVSDIDRLVEQGEFISRNEAVEELLSMGMSAYDTGTTDTGRADEELFTQATEDQQDPAMRDETGNDEYTL